MLEPNWLGPVSALSPEVACLGEVYATKLAFGGRKCENTFKKDLRIVANATAALSTGHRAPGNQQPAPSTGHPARTPQHRAPSTGHPAPGPQHRGPTETGGTANQAPGTQHRAPSTQQPAPSTRHPPPNTQDPTPGQPAPSTPGQRNSAPQLTQPLLPTPARTPTEQALIGERWQGGSLNGLRR